MPSLLAGAGHPHQQLLDPGNLQVLGLGDVAEDELPDGADEDSQEYPVSIQPGLSGTTPAWLQKKMINSL